MSEIATVVKLSLRSTKCSECGLQKICISKGLNGSELKALDDIISSNLKYSADSHLYRQGIPFQGLYVIKSGSTKSSIISVDGNEQIVGFQFPGDILGLDAFQNRLHTSSVIFLENSVVCHMPYDRFNVLCDRIPSLHHRLQSLSSCEITHDHELFMTISQKTAQQRIAFFLMEIVYRLHLTWRNEIIVTLPMQRNEIGNYLGLTQETVSRIFTKFDREGIISVSGKIVRIIDWCRLEEFVSFCNRCSEIICHHEVT
ncbi:MAG: helix-turn-helix domain-containing protein [Methylococcales bacterium]